MTNEILKLAEKCGVSRHAQPKELKAFYRAAFNAGLEAGAKLANEKSYCGPDFVDLAEEIRALKEQS